MNAKWYEQPPLSDDDNSDITRVKYEACADQDDIDLNAWERTLKVNRFMVSEGIKGMIARHL
jgi:hypothetical protein